MKYLVIERLQRQIIAQNPLLSDNKNQVVPKTLKPCEEASRHKLWSPPNPKPLSRVHKQAAMNSGCP